MATKYIPMPTPKVGFQRTFKWTKVLINGSLHLCFQHKNLLAVHSYVDDGNGAIELIFATGPTITTEYKSPDLWKEVLRVLNETLTY